MQVRRLLFDLIIADGSVFGRADHLKTPEVSQHLGTFGLELGIEHGLSFFVQTRNNECLLNLSLEYPKEDSKTVHT